MKTTNCVRCVKKAKLWSGHILIDGEEVTAGWCGMHCLNYQGFKGQYTDKMGLEGDNK